MINLSVDLRALADQTAVCHCIRCDILRRDNISLGIDPPVFFIKIELRNNVDQFHIGFPIRSQSSNILPVSTVFVGKKSLPLVLTIRKDMLAKVTVALCLKCDQSLLQHRPAKYVNSHRSQIAARLLRFLLEFLHTSCLVSHHDAETACFLHRDRHTCNCDIRFVCLVEIQHDLIVHLVDVVAGKNQHIIRIILLHVIEVLENGIGRTGIPFTAIALLIRRKYGYTADITV